MRTITWIDFVDDDTQWLGGAKLILYSTLGRTDTSSLAECVLAHAREASTQSCLLVVRSCGSGTQLYETDCTPSPSRLPIADPRPEQTQNSSILSRSSCGKAAKDMGLRVARIGKPCTRLQYILLGSV